MKRDRTAEAIGAGWGRWPFGIVSEATRHLPIAGGERGVNLERIGGYNCRKVLDAIRCGVAATRLRIAEVSGLSVPAVASITTRLQRLELIEVDWLKGGRGAPAQILRIAADGAFGIGLCVENGVCRSILIDLSGGVRAKCDFFVATDDLAALRRAFIEGLRRLTEMMPAHVIRRVIGIGFAHDGGLDADLQQELRIALARMHVEDGGGRATEAWPLHHGSLNEASVASEALAPGSQLSSFAILNIDKPLHPAVVVVDQRLRPLRLDEPGGKAAWRDTDAAGSATSPPFQTGKPASVRTDLHPWASADGNVEEAVQQHVLKLMPKALSIIRLLNPQALLIGGRMPVPIAQGVAEGLAFRLHKDPSVPSTTVRPCAFGADATLVGTATLPFVDQLFPCDAILMKR